MTYVYQPPEPSTTNWEQPLRSSSSVVLDTARAIYQAFCDTHDEAPRPLGVAIDSSTYRGQLIFSEQPILLPHEVFVNLDQIEPDELTLEAEFIS